VQEKSKQSGVYLAQQKVYKPTFEQKKHLLLYQIVSKIIMQTFDKL